MEQRGISKPEKVVSGTSAPAPKSRFSKFSPLLDKIRKPIISDTISGITFSLAVGAANELLIAGMAPEQSLKSRLMSIPLNAITSRPYGWYRDLIYKITKTTSESSQVKKFFVDLSVFITGQITLYACILTASGANLKQVLTACASMAILSPFIGRPMGAWYDLVRTKLFHLPPAGSKELDKKD